MASKSAAPIWRTVGMTYVTFSNVCANLVRNCLKEPHKSKALMREKFHFSVSKWVDGKPRKPCRYLSRNLHRVVNEMRSYLKQWQHLQQQPAEMAPSI